MLDTVIECLTQCTRQTQGKCCQQSVRQADQSGLDKVQEHKKGCTMGGSCEQQPHRLAAELVVGSCRLMCSPDEGHKKLPWVQESLAEAAHATATLPAHTAALLNPQWAPGGFAELASLMPPWLAEGLWQPMQLCISCCAACMVQAVCHGNSSFMLPLSGNHTAGSLQSIRPVIWGL